MRKQPALLGLGDLVDMLSIVNCRLFALETKARDKSIGHYERGKLTLAIRELNDMKRVVIRNAINRACDKDFYQEIKVK